jgi:3-deoxy-D-manno-octulosonic-acid transferase
LGALHAYYAAADAAFVGGSLAPYGGHNPLEPAACGAAVLMGPHHESQTGAVHALLGRGAIRIAPAGEDLAVALEIVLGDDAERTAHARAALAVAGEQRGAARRAAERLEEHGLWPVR